MIDVSTLDPKNPEHSLLIDQLFGLERAIDLGKVPSRTWALTESQVLDRRKATTHEDIFEDRSFPWRLPNPPPVVEKAKKDLQVLLDRMFWHDTEILRLELRGFSQYDMGKILGMGQVSARTRIRVAKRRLKIVPNLPDFSFDELYRDLAPTMKELRFKENLARAVVTSYWIPNSSKLAPCFGTSQTTLSYFLFNLIRALPPTHPMVLASKIKWSAGKKLIGGKPPPKVRWMANHRGTEDGVGAELARELGLYVPRIPFGDSDKPKVVPKERDPSKRKYTRNLASFDYT